MDRALEPLLAPLLALADRRRQLHAQILEAMKALYGDRLGEHTERLAHHTGTSQHCRAVPSATRALALVEGTDHLDVKAPTLTFLGLTSGYTADFARASTARVESIRLLNGKRRLERFGMNALPASYSRALMGFVLAEQGDFAEALRVGREAIEVAAELKHPFSEAVATMFLAHGHYRRGDSAMAVDLGEGALELSLATGNLLLHPLISVFLAEACVGAGQFERATTVAQEAERLLASMHASLGQRQARCILVDAHLNAGASETALELAAETLELVRAEGQRLLEVWLLKLIGELYASCNPPEFARAQDAFVAATGLAAELGMRPYLAHGRLGLGRVFGRTGRTDDAGKQFTAALSLYRELDMYHWPEQAEAELRALS